MGMKEWILQEVEPYCGSAEFKDHLNREALISYYTKASVVVFPTLYESFGYIATESMAARAVIVASDLDGPAEIITHNKNGVLFTPGSSADLADKLITLLNDPKQMERLQNNGRETVEQVYNSGRITDQVLEFYRKFVCPLIPHP
jgi:glycosyltransferase involved in cell wall biosynthesis